MNDRDRRRLNKVAFVPPAKTGSERSIRRTAKPVPIDVSGNYVNPKKSYKKYDMNYNKNNNLVVGVLIVNYNNLEYTRNCVSDLSKQINNNFQLWVVDQNSNERGTKDYLKELDNLSGITVIRNKTNVDLNKVWNYFYSICNSDILCYLNNDTRLTNNFIDDIIKIFSIESEVGIVIHVTNNEKYTKADSNLSYEVLSPPLSQGWDYSIRKELYVKIPSTLRIFGGDDFIFAHVNKVGKKIALTYSSPIIHYKEKTREMFGNNIRDIQSLDAANYWKEVGNDGLTHVNSTFNSNKCNKIPPPNIKLTQNKKCIFTSSIGNYDSVGESAKGKKDDWDYICYSDNNELESDFWKIIKIINSGSTIKDNYKLARHFKTNFFKYLSSYEYLIWKDSRIIINCDLDDYLAELGDDDFMFMKHNDANSIEEEYSRILYGNLETPEMIEKIKEKYKKEKYKYDNGLFATGILLFKNNQRTIKFFETWWDEIYENSHRDQLSANYALFKNSKLKYKTIPQEAALSPKGFFSGGIRTTERLIFE